MIKTFNLNYQIKFMNMCLDLQDIVSVANTAIQNHRVEEVYVFASIALPMQSAKSKVKSSTYIQLTFNSQNIEKKFKHLMKGGLAQFLASPEKES